MKILYFNYMYDLWGVSLGSTIKAIELMKALRDCGHKIKIVWRREQENFTNGNHTPHKPPHLVKQFMAKFLHEPNQILTNIKFYFEEKKILEQEKPDLLISRLEAYTISSIYLANKKKIPVIVEADGPVAYEKMNYQNQFWTHQKLVDYFEVAALKKSLLSFTVSNQLKKYFIQKGVPGDSIYVIPNGADPDRFRPDFPCDDVKQQYKLRNNLVIGFVGSFHYWHGWKIGFTLLDWLNTKIFPNILRQWISFFRPIQSWSLDTIRQSNYTNIFPAAKQLSPVEWDRFAK